jgi:hypothetical protein
MTTNTKQPLIHLFAYLCISIWSGGLASAQTDPQAEKGDGLFKDGGAGSWGLYTGHAAVYYGYYSSTWGGQYRHTVIQASGPGYSLDIRPFDYTAASPTFLGNDPVSDYTESGHGARNGCSHGTWDGSANTMTLARRSAIITESIRLVGVGVTYPSFYVYPDLWDPTSLNPRSTGTPTAMRCDGLVEWVYEKVGFNTCNNTSSFAYWGLQTVNYHAADWVSASTDTPSTSLQNNGSTYTITATDNSSTPTYVNIVYPDGTTGLYASPVTKAKQLGTTYYQGVDYAGHTESWKQ